MIHSTVLRIVMHDFWDCPASSPSACEILNHWHCETFHYNCVGSFSYHGSSDSSAHRDIQFPHRKLALMFRNGKSRFKLDWRILGGVVDSDMAMDRAGPAPRPDHTKAAENFCWHCHLSNRTLVPSLGTSLSRCLSVELCWEAENQ